ncbi:MAG: pepF, partial [Paenibacillus sp.]|nr:pepF [Paenibacillus sp.]
MLPFAGLVAQSPQEVNMKLIPLIVSVCLAAMTAAPVYAAQDAKPSKTDRRIPMNQVLKRSEVPAENRWRLEDIFADQKAWDNEYDQVKKLVKDIGKFEGKL